MYSYIRGTVIDSEADHIVLDNQGIGYCVVVSNPFDFKKGVDYTVYIHQQVKEDSLTLFGFKSKEQKLVFLKLILVKGIGCKTAIGMLAVDDVSRLVHAIENNNVSYLKKIPGIGPRAAQQIILDLKGKLGVIAIPGAIKENDALEEATEVLIALGYKDSDVLNVTRKLSTKVLDTNGYVKLALEMLVK